jgi:hypothetical protein
LYIITDPILIKSGLRQGDAMSPILFNIVIEKVIREMNITLQEGVKFQESYIGPLADDLVIMEKSQDGLKFLLGWRKQHRKLDFTLMKKKRNKWW